MSERTGRVRTARKGNNRSGHTRSEHRGEGSLLELPRIFSEPREGQRKSQYESWGQSQRERRSPQEFPQLLGAVREQLVEQSSALLPGTSGTLTPALHSQTAPGRLEVSRALGRGGRLLGSQAVLEAAPLVEAHVRGFGMLQEFVDDPAVTDVLVNGPTGVWVDRGRGLTRTATRFTSDAEVRSLAQRLMALGGRRVDDAQPSADVRFAGCRVHALLPPLSAGGTLLSIRINRSAGLEIGDFLGSHVTDRFAEEVLRALMERRRNFLISGGTGSGKTSLLNTMLSWAPGEERIILAEDSAELSPNHPHVVSLQTKRANADDRGEYDLASLLREAMRMRPDRLIVGECRGGEVRELLAAMNTGHLGSGGTLHANSAEAVPARLEAMAALAGLDRAAADMQAASAVDAILHVERRQGRRRLAQIAALGWDGSRLRVTTALAKEGEAWSWKEGREQLEALCLA